MLFASSTLVFCMCEEKLVEILTKKGRNRVSINSILFYLYMNMISSIKNYCISLYVPINLEVRMRGTVTVWSTHILVEKTLLPAIGITVCYIILHYRAVKGVKKYQVWKIKVEWTDTVYFCLSALFCGNFKCVFDFFCCNCNWLLCTPLLSVCNLVPSARTKDLSESVNSFIMCCNLMI